MQTIEYTRHDVETDQDGQEAVVEMTIEKQTTPDRLTAVDHDNDDDEE